MSNASRKRSRPSHTYRWRMNIRCEKGTKQKDKQFLTPEGVNFHFDSLDSVEWYLDRGPDWDTIESITLHYQFKGET